MKVIAITGGIACGKSVVARHLERAMEAPFLSCDEVVADLLEQTEIQESVMNLIGASGGGSGGSFSKVSVRKHAFENSEFREKLESLIHPLVYQRVVDFLGDKSDHTGFLLVEVPLLYEVEFPLQRDLDLVVAASGSTQMARLAGDRGLDSEVATRILDAQLPIHEKIRRADIVVWNDGSLQALNSQLDHLVQRCA